MLLDLGALYGSLVGATEANVRQALRIAEAMSPCVLFVDELEKALAGVGGAGDSGVSTRLFGALLTWLSDHESDVFFVGTCNDISKLPPEFSRAERFDGVFFLDLPGSSEKNTIWQLYRERYGIPEKSSASGRHRLDRRGDQVLLSAGRLSGRAADAGGTPGRAGGGDGGGAGGTFARLGQRSLPGCGHCRPVPTGPCPFGQGSSTPRSGGPDNN